MTDTEAKALALVNEATDSKSDDIEDFSRGGVLRALLHAIEQHEAFKREVSEALIEEWGEEYCLEHRRFSPFILPKPDQLESVVEQVALELGITGASSLHAVRADDFRKKLTAALRTHQKDTNA